MLPNTNHIRDDKARLNIKNKFNDVLAFHSTRKVTSGPLALTLEDQSSRGVQLFANSPFKTDEITRNYYSFQKAKKRYLEHDLMDDDGIIKPLHLRQKTYLKGQLITHCWVALHKGHVVGLISYPVISNSKLHDKNFEKYKTLARIALQTFGYVVACDLVLNEDNQLEIYNIHKEFERRGKTLPYFTRILPVTSHLVFRECSLDLLQSA